MQSHSYSWFNCFTNEQVKNINKEIKKFISKKEYPSLPAQNVVKRGKFSIIPCSPLLKFLHPWLWQCQEINRKVFGYDIYWDFHLDKLNYNVYEKNGEYGWHIDAIKENTPIDMKLTCLLNLSEESYEGGEFCMAGVEEKIKFTSGMGLVFTSLVAHKITPVTKGERITLTYWATGPLWR